MSKKVLKGKIKLIGLFKEAKDKLEVINTQVYNAEIQFRTTIKDAEAKIDEIIDFINKMDEK